ncbi:hypothetical protein ACISK4_02200 [Campylobacter coli]|uniref:hypothetical protein n=1 Tax=Campylobacter coli TaxID=195 RepID=UPI00382753E6
MKKLKYILGLGLLLLTGCESGEYNTNTNVLDIQNDIHKAFYGKTYSDKAEFYEKMQKIINENISMGNTIVQASNIEPKFEIDPIQFKECVFYEIWTIKNPQNTSYTLSAERCQTAFLSNKELIKYADPSFVMGNFSKDNQENILGIKAVKEELAKPSYATDIKSYEFVSDKYKILENGNYIYILQNFKAKSELLGEYTQNAHIIFDNKGNVIKIELNQNKEFSLY